MSESIEFESIAFDATDAIEANFDSGFNRWYLKTTADVRVAFDASVNDGDYLLEATDRVVEIVGRATKVSAIGNSGSGTLYIWATR